MTMVTIGRLAKQAHITTDSIRFYERQGLLQPTTKTDSGYRLYAKDALCRLIFIKHAQRCGFSLADIRELLQADASATTRAALQRKAAEKRAEIERTIFDLRAMSRVLSRVAVSSDVEESIAPQEMSLLSAFERRGQPEAFA